VAVLPKGAECGFTFPLDSLGLLHDLRSSVADLSGARYALQIDFRGIDPANGGMLDSSSTMRIQRQGLAKSGSPGSLTSRSTRTMDSRSCRAIYM
jgi:hypothetical protein